MSPLVIVSALLSFLLFTQPIDPAKATYVNRTALNGRVELRMPSVYKQVSEADVKKRFNQQRLPLAVFGDAGGVVGIVVDEMPMSLGEKDLQGYVDETERQFKAMYSRCKIYSKGVRVVNGQKMGWVEMEYSVPNGAVYNYMAFYPQPNGAKPLMVGFNADSREVPRWRPHVAKIFNSVKIKQ